MANTAISQVVLDSIILEGRTRARIVWGKLAATDKPGQVLYESATGVWTKSDAGTEAHKLLKYAILEFNPRTSATFGEVDIDIAYATTDDVPLVIGSYGGPLKLAAAIEDPGGAKLFGVSLVISSTAGNLEAETMESVGFAGTGTAIRYAFRSYVAEEGFANQDRYGLIYYS